MVFEIVGTEFVSHLMPAGADAMVTSSIVGAAELRHLMDDPAVPPVIVQRVIEGDEPSQWIAFPPFELQFTNEQLSIVPEPYLQSIAPPKRTASQPAKSQPSMGVVAIQLLMAPPYWSDEQLVKSHPLIVAALPST